MSYKRAILTAYEPWGNHSDNPTIDIVEGISGPGNMVILPYILPVSFREAPEEMNRLIDTYTPDIVLETGLKPGARKIRYEKRARNLWEANIPDNDGFKPQGGRISGFGPDYLHTHLLVEDINRLSQFEGLPTRVSLDAGKYVCNSTFYKTLERIEKEDLPIRAGLIHMPWTSEYKEGSRRGKPISNGNVQRAIEIALKNAFY